MEILGLSRNSKLPLSINEHLYCSNVPFLSSSDMDFPIPDKLTALKLNIFAKNSLAVHNVVTAVENDCFDSLSCSSTRILDSINSASRREMSFSLKVSSTVIS